MGEEVNCLNDGVTHALPPMPAARMLLEVAKKKKITDQVKNAVSFLARIV